MNSIQDIPSAFSDQNKNLENFFKQSQANFSNITNLVKNIQNDLQTFKNDMDNTLKQLEMDMEQNQSILERWVAGANTKLKTERISQKRIALLESMKKLNDSINKFSQELSKYVDHFNTSSQQFTINYKNLENQLKSGMAESRATSQQFAVSPANSAIANIQQALDQAIKALNAAQQGLNQRRVFSEINKSLDNLIH